MKTAGDIIYIFAGICFTIIIGAALYEHLAVWPQAFAAPPQSLSMFQGDYGLHSGAFWSVIHPVTILLLVCAVALHWNSERRFYLLVTICGYLVVIAVTFLYFVPELVSIGSTEYSSEIDRELVDRGYQWQVFSIIRMVFMMGLAATLFYGLTKE